MLLALAPKPLPFEYNIYYLPLNERNFRLSIIWYGLVLTMKREESLHP